MGKKLLCIFVIVSILLSLSACSGKPIPSVDSPSTPTSSGATDPVKTSDPTDSTTPSVQEPPATKPVPAPETEYVPVPETQPATVPTAPSTPTTPPEPIEPPPTPTYGHKPLAQTEFYQYSKLTAAEKQLYQKLLTAIQNLQNRVSVSELRIHSDDALVLIQKLLADNPHLFWVSRESSVIYDKRTQNAETILLLYTDGEKSDTISNNKTTAVADRAKISAKRETLENKIAQILGTIPANLPEVERERLIHDYITAHVRYDTVAAANPQPVGAILPHAYDIYGAAIEGKAVCEGYAKLFQYLCYRTGIHATQISGTAGGGGHMWNAVKLDGEWYALDATWDDPDTGIPYYAYFNLTDREMGQTHTANTEAMTYPQCTGTKYCYADYYALKLLSATQLSDHYTVVMDRLLLDGSGYLIFYKNGITLTGFDLNTLAYSSASQIQQYARSRGYRLELANSYTTYEKFVYIAYTAKKM